MKERPIIFTAEMVRAILDGRKTQTRRVIKPQFPPQFPKNSRLYSPRLNASREWQLCRMDKYDRILDFTWAIRCPYGEQGDRLWVRETWAAFSVSVDPETGYGDDLIVPDRIPKDNDNGWWQVDHRATSPVASETSEERGFPWRPSIHMPRWASRIALEVVDVRVERVQEASDKDAMAEGYPGRHGDRYNPGGWKDGLESKGARYEDQCDAVTWFRTRWDFINAKRGFGWDANPWVWVIDFKRVDG